MKIANVGCDYRHPSDFLIDRPCGSGDCLLLVVKTDAFAVLNGKRTEVPQNSVIIYEKGTPQLYGACGKEFFNDWIHFELEGEEKSIISMLGVPFDTVIPLSEVTELSSFIKSIFWERYSQNLHKEESMQRYFELIILKISEKMQAPALSEEHPCYSLFLKLRNDIRLSPNDDWTIDKISKRTCLSRSYVQHLYNLFFSVSIVKDVQNLRIEHAKLLLSETNMKVFGIAKACGYRSDVHFMRIFKRVTGMTPSGFRERFSASQGELEKSKSKPPFTI